MRAKFAKATRWPIREADRRIVVGETVGDLAGDHGARGAAVEHEARDKLRAEDARFLQQLQHLGRAPAVEGSRLRGDQDEIGGEQGRAQQAGDARRAVDDHVVGVAGELRRFPVEGVAGEADHAEQARHGLLGALGGPVESRPLRIGVDDRDALSLGRPGAGQVQGERRLADGGFLVEERDDHRRSSVPAFHRSSVPPTAEELNSSLNSSLGGSETVDWLDENAACGS